MVENLEILNESYESLKKSPVLGVDLEGVLNYNGSLETIQISNFKEVFIYDMITAEKDEELYKKFIEILKSLLENENSVKLYHDCRRDYEA